MLWAKPAMSEPAPHPTPNAALCAVAIMAKASVEGEVKTRLVPPLSFAEAAAFNTACLADVAANLCAAAAEAPIAPFAAYAPEGAERFFARLLPPKVALLPPRETSLGRSLHHAARDLVAKGYGAVCLLNADSPTLPTALLSESAAALARPGDRAVLGPSSDGGYYLLGLKTAHRRLFENIAWSTERVAEQTRERAREIGLELDILPEWYDVDDAASLRRLHAEIFDGAAPTPHRARHTAALLSALWPDGVFGRRGKPRMPTADARMPSGATI